MIDVREASLVDFLPDSIAADREIIALSLAIDPELRAVGAAIVEALIWPRIADLEVEVLDELGWACRLDELQVWDDATVEGKRTLLANIFAIRKKSGTAWAVRRIFDLLSVVGRVVPWFEEDAAAYTYRIIVLVATGDPGLTLHQLVQVPELTHRFAGTRDKLSQFSVEAESTAPLYPYVAPTMGLHITIGFGV